MQKQEFIVHIGDSSIALRLNDQYHNQFTWDTQRHSNADYELHMILSGNCKVSVEDQQYNLSAGNAILISPGHYHNPLVISNAFRKFSVSFFPFSGKVANAIQQVGTASIISLSDIVLQLAKQILDEHNSLPFHREFTGATLSHIMIHTLRKLEISEPSTCADAFNDWRTDVIDDFFAEDLDYGTEMELANKLHLSRRQLSRVMQTHYGMSFRQKMLATKMDQAAWFLRTTDLSIMQICSKVGYSSEAAFYQNFKAYHGVTPLQYRKQHKA